MRHFLQKLSIITRVLMTAAILLSTNTALAEMTDETREALLQRRAEQYQKQKQIESIPSWSFAFDNDVLVRKSVV